MQEELQSIAAMAEPRELDNLTRVAEDARAEWEWAWLEHTGQDVRCALGTLRKSQAFTATAVLSLALGSSAVFITPLNSGGRTRECVRARVDDNSRGKVQNVRGESSAFPSA